MEPVRIDPWGVPVFRMHDVNLYGLPSYYGYEDYIVVSTYEDECPFVLDWNGEQERRGVLRPVHRYSRVERFVSVVYQLLGERGDVPDSVIDVVRHWGFDSDPLLAWNSVRFVLKQYGWAKYYNRIPGILARLGYHPARFQFWKIEEVIQKFKKMSSKFDCIKSQLPSRTYFPNLRYVALRMLEEDGITFNYMIPKIRTKRKLKVMSDIYDLMCE